MKCRRKGPSVSGVRFMPHEEMKEFSDFVARHCDDYRLASQEGLIRACVTLKNHRGQVNLGPGHWLVVLEGGDVLGLPDDRFHDAFEVVP